MPWEQVRHIIAQELHIPVQVYLERWAGADVPSPSRQAAVHSLTCLRYLLGAEYHSCIRHGEAALRWAGQSRRRQFDTLTRFWLGTALTCLGDPPAAVDHLSAVLAQARTCPQHAVLIPCAYFNLGANSARQHVWAAAAAWYHRAAEEFANAGRVMWQARAVAEQTWCLLHMQRDREATPPLQWLEGYTAAHPADEPLGHAVLVYKALLHRLRDELPASLDHCDALCSTPRVAPKYLAEAAWVAGLNYLDSGHLDRAGAYATTALEHAIGAQWTSMINRANQLRRAVARAHAQRADYG